MTKQDQEDLIELGGDLGISVFPVVTDEGRIAVDIGNIRTAILDRAYAAIRSIEAE